MGKQEEFIFAIQPYITAWKKQFGFGVVSAIIAQACLESGYGTSDKAQYNNFFGLKYKGNRVTCNNGKFTSHSKEWDSQKQCYVDITCAWYAFADTNTGVEGYFQFINSGNYAAAKTATTPEAYLQALKDSGYATGPKYVENNLRVIQQYNLTQFDEVTPMGYTNSPLVVYTDLSPRNYGPRTHVIDTITIHHMAGNLSVETCGNLFHRKKGNSNYGIGSDGRIALYVEEKNGAWTSSNEENDMRAVTIEVANEILAPFWTVSALAMNSLVLLVADICQRNNIKQLIWSDDKKCRINHVNGCNMTMHKDFAATKCPGPFLEQCMPNIAMIVNQLLATPTPIPTPGTGYFINGVDYSPVFDPVFYANKYSDLQAAFGNNADLLWNHFCQCGMNEFRQASAEFNPQAYKDRYSDLVAAFGDDNPMYYYHYCTCGKAEGRDAT